MPKPCRPRFVNSFSQLSCTEVPTTNKNLDRIIFKKRYIQLLVCVGVCVLTVRKRGPAAY
jgi:hypothetical protein